MASAGPDRSPEIGGKLLRILVLQDQFGDGPFAERSGRSHGSGPSFALGQLTRDQGDQFPLHGSRQQRNAARHFQKKRQILDALAARFVQQPLLLVQRREQPRRRLVLFAAAAAAAATAATAAAVAAAAVDGSVAVVAVVAVAVGDQLE